MRKSLEILVKETIKFEFKLPCGYIQKSICSNQTDKCFSSDSPINVSKIIYNGIIEFAKNEFEIDYTKLDLEQRKALKRSIRCNSEATDSVKQKYGFYGEVLLDLVLRAYMGTQVFISKGYFYSPLENGEAKGYDVFHLIQKEEKVQLWFGEAKFYQNYKEALDKILDNLENALSDKYLNRNLLAILDEQEHATNIPIKIKKIFEKWEQNPDINLANEISTENIKLIYPIFVAFDKKNKNYNTIISECITYFNQGFIDKKIKISSSFEYSLFFILLPLDKVKEIKGAVIEWITERATNLIKTYNVYKKDKNIETFIKAVCQYYDWIKDKKISQSDIEFLYFFANKAGIPQYFDMLNSQFKNDSLNIEYINLPILSSMMNNSSLIFGDEKLHKYQKEILIKFKDSECNRYVLSAPTSFGKTFLIYQIIEKIKYKNIVLIFPTISLLSENYEKLLIKTKYNLFWQKYTLHTLSDDDTLGKYNIWILTPERFLSLIDNKPYNFDFVFVDEIYKIDNHYIIDVETSGENERDIAYRVALEYVCRKSKDILLAGPYMSVGDFDLKNKNSFRNFINDKGFTLLDYNQIEIVDKEVLVVKGKKKYNIDGITITLNNKNEYSKVASIINSLTLKSENTIVYYSTKSGVERYAREIAPYLNIPSYDKNIDLRLYNMFIQHLEKEFGDEWIITRSLKKGIGIHHGLVPKYIQKQIIEFFNEGILTVLISTTTITEGVNTSAKNIIIRSDKKGTKALKHFDAMNIAGRAGRFYHHYTGRVIVVDNNFNDIYKANDEILEHKNFDIETKKNDIDYLITDSKYLKNHDIQNRDKIYMEVVNRNIPFDIVEQFKTIGIRDKLYIFDSISKLTFEEINEIKSMITKFNYTNNITWDGFQIIVNIICPIVTNKTVSTLIKMRCKNNEEYSLLTAFVYYYLRDGFFGVLNNYLKKFPL